MYYIQFYYNGFGIILYNRRNIVCQVLNVFFFKALCSPGSYNEQGGLEPCITCPLSTYQPVDGATECYLCPDNSTTLSNGSVSVTDCVGKLKHRKDISLEQISR